MAIASTGHSKIMIGIRSLDLLHSLKPDMEALTRISCRVRCNGYYVFTLHPHDAVLVHGRMFAPAIGIAEDPVTGNANGPLGAYLVHFGICRGLWEEDKFAFSILQGEAIHRDGGMTVHVSIQNGRPGLVQIVGKAVVAFKTEILL
jgi:PhzF family phenazine biosynthesis protein